jgi:NAD(P)-dependent dehydrogenase (short-subunit alcohol dehydrogenase family)
MALVVQPRPIALIAGIATGLGASLAEAFAVAGHDVLGLARSDRCAAEVAERVAGAGGAYTHSRCDLTDGGQVIDALRGWEGRIDVFVYNAHELFVAPLERTTFADVERLWRVGCHGAAHVALHLLPGMAARGRGTALFTGATASLRGSASFAAFAAAKFALRGFAQALAREYAPQGVHVAHVVIDGLIDEPQSDARWGAAATGRMDPRAVAQTYVHLAAQDRSAWTQEIDLRPQGGKF